MPFILCRLPGLLPATPADLRTVQKRAVQTAEILQLHLGRRDLQNAVITGNGTFRQYDAAILLPAYEYARLLSILKPLPCERAARDFERYLTAHKRFLLLSRLQRLLSGASSNTSEHSRIRSPAKRREYQCEETPYTQRHDDPRFHREPGKQPVKKQHKRGYAP